MPPPPSSQAGAPETFNPAAAVVAAVFPGLGHFHLGQTKRAILITVGVMGLYLTGIAVGGVACVDRRDNFIWFLGQALVGPVTFGLDYVHQNKLKVMVFDPRMQADRLREPYPNEARDPRNGHAIPIIVENGIPVARTADKFVISPAYPSNVKAVPRSNELGTLFTTIAGFLNVIVIIDAAFGVRVERKRKPIATGVSKTLRVPGAAGVGGSGGGSGGGAA